MLPEEVHSDDVLPEEVPSEEVRFETGMSLPQPSDEAHEPDAA